MRLPKFVNKFLKRITNSYAAAAITRLATSFPTFSFSADYEIRYALRIVRARSRDLWMNNPYAKKFVKMCSLNMVGPKGVKMQPKVLTDRPVIDKKTGEPIEIMDSQANSKIHEGWKKWGKRGNCDVTGRLSFVDCERLFAETLARDGEVLIREIINFPNEFGYALQFIDIDCLDEQLNRVEPNGNIIKMGVEQDSWNRPVAYWILERHPGELMPARPIQKRWDRIPAEEIIHAYLPDRVNQSRGMPWMHAIIGNLNQLGGLEEAELVASRMAAAQMGFIQTEEGDYPGNSKDSKGNPQIEAEPGTFPVLPEGWKMQMFNPTHPNGNFQNFAKHMLRSVASGMLVSYNSLATDLEGVNYSSIRAGVLEERDCWMMLQKFMIEALHERIFPNWLKMSLLKQIVHLPLSKFDRFNSVKWQPRTWQWVDPLKDVAARVEALNAGMATRTGLNAEDGKDYETDILHELAEEKKLEEKYGITYAAVAPTSTSLGVAKEEPAAPTETGGKGSKKTSAQAHHGAVMNMIHLEGNDE